MMISLLTFILFDITLTSCLIVDPGPTVIATKGEVWPIPQKQVKINNFRIVRQQMFTFKIVSESCNVLTAAIDRYMNIIDKQTLPQSRANCREPKSWSNNEKFAGYLNSLDIILMDPCQDDELPDHTMLENYDLKIASENGTSSLAATSIWGILRGLETFSQLLYPIECAALLINCTSIDDFPRYSHRGLLVDTSRHFIPVSKILKTLDAMAYNKLNVFHWHMTDDQSFPYQSRSFPELSEKGSYHPTQVYSQNDVSNIIKRAGSRGIRVIVEFDTPGHTRSWGLGVPELLTPCYENNKPTGQYGPMDPSKNFTYTFMEEFLTEVVGVFPDKYLHLGGDEVQYECWESDPGINHFMHLNNIPSFNELEGYYIKKLIDMSVKLNAIAIVWEEMFVNVVNLPKDTIIQLWQVNWENTMKEATKAGFQTIMSACWYLDHIGNGGDWINYYNCEPSNFGGDEQQKKLVLGGEACMWAEVVNENNFESRIWPRACAAAEKLWSAKNADTIHGAQRRLEEHTCRMNKRGIQAQPPNGAGFCVI